MSVICYEFRERWTNGCYKYLAKKNVRRYSLFFLQKKVEIQKDLEEKNIKSKMEYPLRHESKLVDPEKH